MRPWLGERFDTLSKLIDAFDYDQVRMIQPDVFVCLVDNIEVVHHRLHRDHEIDATLKDCMVWREEEILATELLSQAIPGSKFYILSRGRHNPTTQTLFRLTCPNRLMWETPALPPTIQNPAFSGPLISM